MKIRLTVTALAVTAAFPAFSQGAVTTDEATLTTTVVTATRQAQRVDEVLASVDVITREEIERAGNRTLVELLASRPGVQITNSGGAGSNTSVFIRGANSQHTLLLIDGVRVGSATAGSPNFETIPLGLIERVEILRGPASSLYGADALGGVIQIFTRRGESGFVPRFHLGVGSWDTYTASAGFSGGADRLRYSLDLGHDRTRGFDAKPASDLGSDGDRDGWRNNFLNASVSVGLRERDEIGFNYWHTDGRNWYDRGRSFNSYLDKNSRALGLHLRSTVTDGWTSTLRWGWSKDESRDRETSAKPDQFDTMQRQLTWQHDLDLAGGSLMLAYERLTQTVDSTTSYDEKRRAVNSFLAGWGGNFGNHDVQVNVRRDRNSQFGSRNTGSLAYGYQVADTVRLVASVGTAFRAPSFNQLYWPGFGNPDLKPERALNREIGMRWDDGRSQLDVTYFHNRIRDLIAGWPAVNIDPKIKGLELVARTTIGAFDLSAGFDWLDARNTANNTWLPRRARHSGYLRVDTQYGKWRLGGEVTGQGKRYDSLNNIGRMSGYALLNIHADYQFADDWRLELRANNVLDKKYTIARVTSLPVDNVYAAPRANVFIGLRYAPR